MDVENVVSLDSRIPQPQDLVPLCQNLNNVGANYIVIGAFAMIRHGFNRVTDDIDLLIDGTSDNLQRVKRGLEFLPGKFAAQIRSEDFLEFAVIRIADEFVLDLMLMAGGVTFTEAQSSVEWQEYKGVRIPFPSARMLLRMKETNHCKDAQDRDFLRAKLGLTTS